MAGRPGDGCDDPREVHKHWCGFCGAALAFASVECRALIVVPRCPRCGGTDWRDDVDDLTAPNYREH